MLLLTQSAGFAQQTGYHREPEREGDGQAQQLSASSSAAERTLKTSSSPREYTSIRGAGRKGRGTETAPTGRRGAPGQVGIKAHKLSKGWQVD